MEKKLLLFDLDDTLLTTEKIITQSSIEAIQACKASGMFIGYITGRARPSKAKANDRLFFVDRHNLPCDFIAYYNGAEICVGGTSSVSSASIESNLISFDNAMKMINRLLGIYPNAKIGVMFEPWSYSSKSGENWNNETGEKIKCTIFELPDYNIYDVQRLRIEFAKDDDNDKSKLKDCMTAETNFFVTADGTAMILHKNARKERALIKASEYFDIPLSDIIAFGDDINDMNMLKTAGIGVAMGNAIDCVKEIADFITETNDNEGISIWINKYLLN
jgi:Cof subfamily protein (haloacid dehalogenase superfamily)